MRFFSVTIALILFPATAFACSWGYEPSPPLDFLVVSNVFAAIIAAHWVVTGPRERRYLPEVTIAVSVAIALAIGALSRGDNWSDMLGLFGLIPLAFPYLLMKQQIAETRQKVLALVLIVFCGGIGLVFGLSASEGRYLPGFSGEPIDAPEIVF